MSELKFCICIFAHPFPPISVFLRLTLFSVDYQLVLVMCSCFFLTPEHTCELCSKTFPKRHLLNNHKRSHHGQRSPLPCPREGCDRQYWDQKNLNAHIRHYHEHQRFSCAFPSCGKTFASKVSILLSVVLDGVFFFFFATFRFKESDFFLKAVEKKGVQKNFECKFSPFRIQTLTLSVPRKLSCCCRPCAREFSGKMGVN